MEVIEIISESDSLTVRQRWSHVFTIAAAVLLLLLGFNLRAQTLAAVTFYESPAAGITALYPQNWLLDTSGDYVFRVRDMTRTGYKTTIQVAVQPIGPDATERNLADRLTLDRLQRFTRYEVQPLEPFTFAGREINAQAMRYTYVASDVSPFLQGIPSVVRGLDVLAISGGQAIIISFRADATVFESELPRFEQFLSDLEF